MKQVKSIEFIPCTGFGSFGRSATLRDSDDAQIGIGYGATDEESVLEALIDLGASFDQAFNLVSKTISQAKIYRDELEFPAGEFPLV
jgi:hypothetical protein